VSTALGELQDEYVRDIVLYRKDLRHYLADLSWAPEWRCASFGSTEAAMTHDASVMARLYDAGWNRYGWPTQGGGLGGNEIHRAVFYEEFAHAMLPVPAQQWTLEVLGPALLRFAPRTAAQYLPRYLSGIEWWGQGFSEPESGSDLASLRTRARDDGAGGLIINGQKIWTSQGATATRLLVLARTGTAESRHRGLSMILIDVDTPGVTVRPIALASGRRELAEVFFDDVRVPHERLVGGLGDGWAVTMYLMQYERGMYGYGALTKLLTMLSRLRETMAAVGAPAADRERFARVFISVVAGQARSAATVKRLAGGHPLGPDSSIDKLLFSRAEQDVNDLIFDMQRQLMVAGENGGSAEELSTMRADWWYARAATIMGGSAEMQRGIVADHILGLPKENH